MAVGAEPQTVWDHLEELRKSIFHVLAVFVSLAVVMFFFKNFLFDKVVLAPASSDFFLYRMLGVDFSLSLVNTPQIKEKIRTSLCVELQKNIDPKQLILEVMKTNEDFSDLDEFELV